MRRGLQPVRHRYCGGAFYLNAIVICSPTVCDKWLGCYNFAFLCAKQRRYRSNFEIIVKILWTILKKDGMIKQNITIFKRQKCSLFFVLLKSLQSIKVKYCIYRAEGGIALGKQLLLQCTECDYNALLRLGNGRNDYKDEVVLDSLSGAPRDALLDVLNLGARKLAVKREMGVCPQCGALFALAIVSCVVNGTEQQTFYGSCPVCGASGEECTGGEPPYVCPACGGSVMCWHHGIWD